MAVLVFNNDESGYLSWATRNPGGFVVNTRNVLDPQYLVLHRASCTAVLHHRNMERNPGGFDPAQDIAGITVNRWSHGYAYSIDAESGDVAWSPKKSWQHERRPWADARQSIGNIVIAGTDAASNAMTESGIEEAHRAVHELM